MKKRLINGVLVDQASTLHRNSVEIVIEDDVILAVGPQGSLGSVYNDTVVIDLKGSFVSPGWIDAHVHCFAEAWGAGIVPDRIGVQSGVTMLIDAGSSGANNVAEFYQNMKMHQTKVRALLNISEIGLENLHELRDINQINVDKAVEAVKAYPDFIVGYKLRASASVMGEDMTTPFTRAKEMQKKLWKPLMVHVGNFPPSLDDVLDHLEQGDIMTHCYHGKPNGVILDGKIRESAQRAKDRGVIFDVGHGAASFNYNVAKKAYELGFHPVMCSTDIYRKNVDGPVYSMAHTMSKLLAVGYSMDDVIAMNTSAPAKIFSLEGYGSVKAGNKADLTIFRLIDRTSKIQDSDGNWIQLNQQIVPAACTVDGKWVDATYGNDEHIQ